MKRPELSIIIPVLNEREQLPGLLENLGRQQLPAFELLIVDGGSTDGSLEWLQTRESELIALKLLHSPAGRGRQLNHALDQARGEWLLLLHVDSRFEDPLAVQRGIDRLARTESRQVAGHFALSFRQQPETATFGYYYFAWKARLGRPETIHGDQGFLLRRAFQQKIGRFREDLPVMEDTDFAERVRLQGGWLLLPAEISTSARRFELEGLRQRQLLNAVMMCLRGIGYARFFQAAPGVYRRQNSNASLRVQPFFALVRKLFSEHSPPEKWRLWWRCGCYVRKEAWQLAFAGDARRAFRQGLPAGAGKLSLTEKFEPVYELLTDNPAGRLLATLLLRVWFEVADYHLRRSESG